jgi:hypothetical protein
MTREDSEPLSDFEDARQAASVPLVCVECGRESDEQARGWRALVLSDDDEHPQTESQAVLEFPGGTRGYPPTHDP